MSIRAQVLVALVEDNPDGSVGIVWQYECTQVIPFAEDPKDSLAAAAVTVHDQINLARDTVTEQIAATTGMLDAEAQARSRPIRRRPR